MLLGIRTKLTLVTAAAMTVTVGLLAAGLYIFVRDGLMDAIDAGLRDDGYRLEQTLDGGASALAEWDRLGLVELFRVTEQGWLVHASSHWLDAGLGGAPAKPSIATWTAAGGRPMRLFTRVSADGMQISVARDITQTVQVLERMRTVIAFGVPAALLLVLAIGSGVASRALAPLNAMTDQVNSIHANHLDARLYVPNPNDEVGRLATALNHGFNRLEDAFARLKQFTSDASHELRTPLAVIRSTGELALEREPDPAQLQSAVSSMLEEIRGLELMIDSLLMLTRADAGRLAADKTTVDLGILVKETAECLGVLADEKEQDMTVETQVNFTVLAHADSLRRALLNVIDNAIRYTPKGGAIGVKLIPGEQAGTVEIHVTDNGSGIPKEHRADVFERFHRIESARTRSTGGTGLGLAIARAAIEANNGTIGCVDTNGSGAHFRIVLKKA